MSRFEPIPRFEMEGPVPEEYECSKCHERSTWQSDDTRKWCLGCGKTLTDEEDVSVMEAAAMKARERARPTLDAEARNVAQAVRLAVAMNSPRHLPGVFARRLPGVLSAARQYLTEDEVARAMALAEDGLDRFPGLREVLIAAGYPVTSYPNPEEAPCD